VGLRFENAGGKNVKISVPDKCNSRQWLAIYMFLLSVALFWSLCVPL